MRGRDRLRERGTWVGHGKLQKAGQHGQAKLLEREAAEDWKRPEATLESGEEDASRNSAWRQKRNDQKVERRMWDASRSFYSVGRCFSSLFTPGSPILGQVQRFPEIFISLFHLCPSFFFSFSCLISHTSGIEASKINLCAGDRSAIFYLVIISFFLFCFIRDFLRANMNSS